MGKTFIAVVFAQALLLWIAWIVLKKKDSP